MNKKKILVLVLFAAGLSVFATSCFFRPYRRRPVAAAYNPMLYNGYVVYYTQAGQPYYYIGGARYWVPRTHWGTYRAHYFRYRGYYWRWYRWRGYSYRGRFFRRGYFRGRYWRRGYRFRGGRRGYRRYRR